MKSFWNTVRYKLTTRHKNNKAAYYLQNFLSLLIPNFIFRGALKGRLDGLNTIDKSAILQRVNYYNKMTAGQRKTGIPLRSLKIRKKQKVYFFDSYRYTRHFDGELRASFLFGDINIVPETPSIVKSRPIGDHNANSVLLNLNKIRHFIFVNDKRSFDSKVNMLVGRGAINRPHRTKFYEMYFNHPMCNLGQTNKLKRPEWVRDWLTIDDQLAYKFILCLEGNDVASNLKWVMSSNSVAVMPRPKFETWFMEGTLIPDYHYICIKDDYSDLEERLNYYIEHQEEAKQIIRNAHEHVRKFQNPEKEDLISLLVLTKYFEATGQLESSIIPGEEVSVEREEPLVVR